MKKKKLYGLLLLLIVITTVFFLKATVFKGNEINSLTNELTLKRIKEIRSTKNTDISNRTGKIYYLSLEGDDEFDGLSPDSAWKSITKLNNELNKGIIKPGDSILLKRGDIYRGNIVVKTNDILIGSYGDDDKNKPALYGSTYDGAIEGEWIEVEPNIWKYTYNNEDKLFTTDIGTIWFFCNEGNNNCVKETQSEERTYSFAQKIILNKNIDDEPIINGNLSSILTKDLDFYHAGHAYSGTTTGGAIYLYSTSDPSTRFDEIEFAYGSNGIGLSGYTNLIVDNLEIKFFGRHGVGTGTVANLKVTNSEVAFIGGSTQKYYEDGSFVRYGNGIEIYGAVTTKNGYEVIEGYVVQNNYVHEMYDAGLTFQYTTTSSSPVERVVFDNNVVEYCSYNIEYWNVSNSTDQNDIDNTYLNKIYFTNNIFRFTGYGLTETRPSHGYEALIKTWNNSSNPTYNKVKNGGEFIIENNIFDSSNKDIGPNMLDISAKSGNSVPTLRNNTFYNYYGNNLGYFHSVEDVRANILYTSNLNDSELASYNNKFYVYNEPNNNYNTIYNGTSNEVSWELNTKTKTLTISGNGDMDDYSEVNLPEWYNFKDIIEHIIIDENVTYIGKYAFYNLTQVNSILVNSIKLKDMVSYNYTFYMTGRNFTGITLTFGENVTYIPKNFTNSHSSNNYQPYIKYIDFKGNKLEHIGASGLTKIAVSTLVLPDSVTKIDNSGLAYSKYLKVVVLPNNLEKVSKNLLRGCSLLERVILGKYTNEIEDYAFYDDPYLNTLYIPSTNFVIRENMDILNTTKVDKHYVYGYDNLSGYINDESIEFINLKDKEFNVLNTNSYTLVTYDKLLYDTKFNYEVTPITNSSVISSSYNYYYTDRHGYTYTFKNINDTVRNDVVVESTISELNSCYNDHEEILFIGNSLSTGFGRHGMASTSVETDYVYHVMKYINSLNSTTTYQRFVANPWEGATTSDERNEILEEMLVTIENKKQNNIGTIFIQLGDNVNTDEKRSTFETDLIHYINRIKETYPNAKIYFIFGRYNYKKNIEYIKNAVKETNIELIDIYEIATDKRYDSYIGAPYYNSKGELSYVTEKHASHPGDYGFTMMAKIIIEHLKDNNYCRFDSIESTKYLYNEERIVLTSSTKSFDKTSILNNITSYRSLSVLDKNNIDITNTVSNIGTGMKMKSGTLIITVVSRGDVTGDGYIDLADVSKLYNYYKGTAILENEYLEAAKICKNKEINLADVSKLYNYYKGNIESLEN